MSKGGSTSSEVKIPEYIEAAAQRNLNRADKVSQLGYVPEYGPTVAAFTPMQQAAFQNTANTADEFGMSSPTSQRDIMGGMAPPMTYANGVRGYSSAPMYEQMVAELAANRPGQKSYIDSFFIDPQNGNYSSQAPIDYTQYNTMAQDARNEASADRDNQIAVAEAGAPRTYNTSTTTMSTPTSYLLGGVNDPFLTSAPSQAIAGLSTPSDMTRTADGSYVRSGSAAPTTSIRPVARPDPGESSSGKVICTALHELGRLSDDVYALDAEFGLRVNSEDPMLGDGYRLWATSVANYIKGDSIGSKIALAIVSPVAKAWAAEMAHVMRPEEYKPSVFGKALMVIGHPICRMIGKVFLPKMNKEAV